MIDGELLVAGGQLALGNGGSGTLARYDGERLCIERDVADDALSWLDGDTDGLWAVGGSGAVVHDVEGARTRPDIDTTATRFGVWVAGNDGIAAVLRDGAWTCPKERLTQEALHVVHRVGEDVLFLGGNLDQWLDKHGTVVRWSASARPVEIGDTCD